MGMFDTVRTGDGREGQVKLWDRVLDTYAPGSRVPAVEGLTTYAIAMREGGYVNVEDGVLREWAEQPRQNVIFDKWGRVVE